MDLSFSRPLAATSDAVPTHEAAALFAALGARGWATTAIDHRLFAPPDGAFNDRIARLLSSASISPPASASGTPAAPDDAITGWQRW